MGKGAFRPVGYSSGDKRHVAQGQQGLQADEGDILYDDIACGMLIKKLQYEKRELLESLEMFYKVFFLGEDV